MPDPANLPRELFDEVLNHFTTDVPSLIPVAFDESDTNTISLHACCLVSHRWNVSSTPRLYSRWNHSSAKSTLTRLWNFLRTLLNKPDFARLVQYAAIKGFHSKPPHYDDLPLEAQESVRNAIQMAGMAQDGSSTLPNQDLTDPRLLMALILTCLPNLQRLDALIYDNDQHFKQVIRLASQNSTCGQPRRRAFQHLNEFYMVRTPVGSTNPDSSTDGVWPTFRLPRIRKLSVFDFPDQLIVPSHKEHAGTSPLTHLAAVVLNSSFTCFAATEYLLTLPQRLVHISFYLEDFDHPSDGSFYISNEQFAGLLVLHRNSLEYFDFYRERQMRVLNSHKALHTHLDLLRSFRCLKSLLIHPEDLVGGCCGSPEASFRLRDTLPPNLESLTLYGRKNFTRLPDMEEEITEVVYDKSFAQLKTVVLQKPVVKSSEYKELGNTSWRTLREACEERAIDFRIADRNTLPMGGSNLRVHKRSWSNH